MLTSIKTFLDKLYVAKQIVPTVHKRGFLVVLPYLGTFSLNLRKRFNKPVSKSLLQCNIKVICQSRNWLSSFFKFKDSIPLYLGSHLIYKIQCSNCIITYYGKTERHLKFRDGEHISTSPLTGKGSITTKNLPLKITAFCLVTCVHLRILLSWIMSHTRLNGWSKNLYWLPRINHYWKN